MSDTPTCPYCHAAVDPDWNCEDVRWFRCGTMINRNRINRTDQTNQCVADEVGRMTDQLDQLLQKVQRLEEELESHVWKISPAMAQARIDQLNEKVKRLEDAGDDMARYLDSGPYAAERRRAYVWNTAKETKP